MHDPAPSLQADSTSRRRWLLAIPLGALLAGAIFPIDGTIADLARSIHLGGDLRRELETLQQFGQGSAIVLTLLLVWTLDPARRGRLWSYAGAMLLTFAIVQPMKMLVGRPRPKFDEPWYLCGPFGSYPISPEVGVRHAWELGSGISSDLWSMPSSHTAYALVMAVFLGRLYPKAGWVFGVLAVIVGLARVLLGAHYPSDVVMGGAIGLGVSMAVVAPAGRGRRGGADRGGGRG
ncbi:MAG: phosphatase PAP2 family protein [Phycisphaerales bacterium]